MSHKKENKHNFQGPSLVLIHPPSPPHPKPSPNPTKFWVKDFILRQKYDAPHFCQRFCML